REAAALARQAIEAAPHAERYLLLAEALRAMGSDDQARAAEATFERLALANVDQPDNENHDLVLYYLERDPQPDRALSIARLESARRQDVHTLDRLAWALRAAGKNRQARRILERVLRTGSRDPIIAQHARALGLSLPS